MSKLYVINTPCWTELSPSGLSGESLFNNPFSDHFTFLYYNFMKYGLVDEVKIIVEDKRWRVDNVFIKDKLETEYGTMQLYRERDKEEVINGDKGGYLYCWSRWEDCKKFDKFTIVNPMFNGYTYKNVIDKSFHNYALIEGQYYSQFLPDDLPYDVLRYISYDCVGVDKSRKDHEYDWIMVSSFDPRKRHLDFLKSIYNTPMQHSKGCIIGRNPDNKKRRWEGHNILDQLKEAQNLFNFDIMLNATQEEKINLLLKSKIFVCVSALDNGPRAQVEAAQLNLPILSMPHVGSSDMIISGKNGEIISDLKEIPSTLQKMIKNYENYDCTINDDILNPDNFMPKIIERIRERSG